MPVSRKLLVPAGIVLIVVAASSCSSDSNSPAASNGGASTTAPARTELATGVGQPATITPAQMLAATNGATPVAFAQPANGRIAYGPGGAMVYTPNAGFSGP